MHNFRQRCVQDLAWVMQSPPLISGIIDGVNWWGAELFQGEYEACLPALHQLDTGPTPLLRAIADAKSKRLGHYFEALVAYWFSMSPNYDLLLANHQLRTPQKTLGELDFLLREYASDKVIHLEVSVKFYLGTNDLNDMANWHGPGLKDRLDRKFQHLRTHQTQLARKYPELMPYAVDETACLMKGRLFYPAGVKPATDFTSKSHLFGRWYELPDSPEGDGPYVCLGKDRWLAEVEQPPLSNSTLLVQPDNVAEATLYSELFPDETKEKRRFFVLPGNFWHQLRL